MSKPINIKQSLQGVWAEIARICDQEGRKGVLDVDAHKGIDEVSIFNKACEEYKKNKTFKVKGKTYGIFENKYNKSVPAYHAVDITDTKSADVKDGIIVVPPKIKPEKRKPLKDIEAFSAAGEIREKKINEIKTAIETLQKKNPALAQVNKKCGDHNNEWAQEIYNVSNKFNIDPKIIIAIVAKEVQFKRKPPETGNGKGPMQVTLTTVEDFVPGSDWYKLFKKMDNKLLEDIMNDSNNKTVSDIHTKCQTDSVFGIKVGVLALKMKYLKKRGANYGNFDSKLEKIKSEPLNNYKAVLRDTFKSYNSVDGKEYAKVIIKYLDQMDFKYDRDPFNFAKSSNTDKT